MTQNLSRRTLVGSAAALVLTGRPSFAEAKAPVLLELFTSQGCSSCPPADKILGQIKSDPNIFAVSFNVDYWDYLGWRDTLAKPEFSRRQFDYGKSRGDMQVYTPQVVVNGRAHAVGSSREQINAAIAAVNEQPVTVQLQLQANASDLTITIAASDFRDDATLWLFAVEPKVTQVIERGENSGKSIVYHNVVRNMMPVGTYRGEATTHTVMHDAVMKPGCTSCLAVLQEGRTGPVLGIARLMTNA